MTPGSMTGPRAANTLETDLMNEMISTQFLHVGLKVADQNELFTTMTGSLMSSGRVRASYLQALLDREAVFPTGLPVGCGVAIPHADAEHVLTDTIAIATLTEPVNFGEMGGSDDLVAVRVVIMLALTATGGHIKILQRVVKAIQNTAFLDAVTESKTAEELAQVAMSAFQNNPVT